MLHANDLLDQRIIENGSFVPHYAAGSASQAILEMVQLIRLTLTRRKLQIQCDTSRLKRLPCMEFDKRRFQQVLLNLLSNAVKFSTAGVIAVNTLVFRKANGDNILEVSVEDEGVGLTREEAQNVFTPFVRFHSPRHQMRNQLGNGVGLSICKQICQQLEGDIAVESAPEKGTKFTFTMKVVLVNRGSDRVPSRERNAVATRLGSIEEDPEEGTQREREESEISEDRTQSQYKSDNKVLSANLEQLEQLDHNLLSLNIDGTAQLVDPPGAGSNGLTTNPLAAEEMLPPIPVRASPDHEILEEPASRQVQFQGLTFNVSSDKAVPYEIASGANKSHDCKALLNFLNVLKQNGVLATRNDSGLLVVADD